MTREQTTINHKAKKHSTVIETMANNMVMDLKSPGELCLVVA
jgi:hypothetical protein